MDTRMNGALRTSSGALPNEIMAELFIFCLDSDHLGCMTPSPTTAPLVFTQVCRKWRNIALASPRLWTGISLNDEDLKGSLPLNSKQLLPLLDSWIAQSGSRPISIRLSYTKLPKTGEYSDYRKGMRLVVDRLLRCQHRWHALDLNVLDLFTVQPLLDAVALPDNVPLLRRFIVEVPERSLDSVNTRTNDLALWAQKRTSLVLYPRTRIRGHAHFERLRNLDLTICLSTKTLLQWVDLAPNLETLCVILTSGEERLEGDLVSRVRRLTKLKELEVYCCYSRNLESSDPGPFLAMLELPALMSLVVDMVDMIAQNQTWTHVTNLLYRSNSPLEMLTLLRTPMSEEDVLKCLRRCPRLIYLNLAPMTDNILRALTSSIRNGSGPARAPLCPSLKMLETPDKLSWTLAALGKMVSSRCKGKSTRPYKSLEKLVIPHDPNGDDGLMGQPDIVRCLKNGMSLENRSAESDSDDDPI